LVHLAAVGFRNLAPIDLALESPFHVFYGENGHGKTNLLEAIYFLSTLKPLRGHRTRDLIQWEAKQAQVSAGCRDNDLTRRFRVDLTDSARVCSIDGKKVQKTSEYFGGIRCIAFTPSDGRIVLDEPALRRNWIDRAAFTKHPVHLDIVRTYERIRSQKSIVLREPFPDHDLLDVLDEQLAKTGAALISRRLQIIEELIPQLHAVHTQIVGRDEPITLRYRSPIEGQSEEDIAAALNQRFTDKRSDEIRRRSVLFGPHRDDIELLLSGKPARLFGSRGQVRSIVLSLKLAELLAAQQRGQHPIFLLDDLSSELDAFRTKQLVETLEQLGTQVFITTTDPNFLRTLPEEKTRFVHVNFGETTVGGPGA